MKKLLLILLALHFSGAKAQNSSASDASSQIDITAYVPDQIEGLTDIARNNLENKLSQIITSSGLGVSSENSRFIITANVVVLTKDITPTAPPMQAYTLGVNLYIGDGMEGIKFSSCSITLKGVGENETKAYMSALKNLKVDDPKYQDFIAKAKVKIVDYYNRKCDFIIKDAKSMASQGQYEAALFKLATIPDACKVCYDKSLPVSKVIYKQYIDNDCKVKLNQAKNIWNTSQDESGAYTAGEYLTEISPNAACYNEAKAFTDKIGAKILADNNKAWSFRMKVYQDEVSADKAALKAERDIALAYAKSTSVNYIVTGWW
ncbi:hypothetical protein B0A75_06230 [Flavobacterium oncorhynchi]|uniref:DUF541 domain-containing protein n=1 Tax=Flavobacterium oncorhynchi TaxID=728056 RepID=A0A226I4Q1_9FLAO|nr:hypothetical protein [Flavobacterium oncorhynchi]OXB01163.1 hypothetical protein B0A75_06230 [Flavobacterium oncorhynchi]